MCGSAFVSTVMASPVLMSPSTSSVDCLMRGICLNKHSKLLIIMKFSKKQINGLPDRGRFRSTLKSGFYYNDEQMVRPWKEEFYIKVEFSERDTFR